MAPTPRARPAQPEEVAMDEQRRREVEQGLREPSGTLIGGLDVGAYVAGMDDFDAGRPPPLKTTTSYDLGRARALREFEQVADVRRKIEEEMAENRRKTRALLADCPEGLAAFDAATLEDNMARLERRKSPGRTTGKGERGIRRLREEG